MVELQIKTLDQSSLNDFLEWFDNRAFADNKAWKGCYCQFYLDDPETTDVDSLSEEGNRQNACDRVANGKMTGYLAYLGEEVVGWCAAGPANQYLALPKTESDVARVMCFVIDPMHRGQGYATELLDAACADLKAKGFRVVEAAPIVGDASQSANYHGPIAMYLKAQFEEVTKFEDGRILMHKLL
jgi:ribosomal protein S18 acetylase RimI-like enzyme